MGALEELARAEGIGRLSLSVNNANRAKGFYRSLGYTLVSDANALGPLAIVVRALLNKVRFVNNYFDTSDGLRRELESRFENVIVERAGALAFFVAGQIFEQGGENHAS